MERFLLKMEKERNQMEKERNQMEKGKKRRKNALMENVEINVEENKL
jgi:hypothetical protein